MRTATYETNEQRRELLDEAHALGEQMYHDDFLDDGTKRLTFDVPQPEWVEYFQNVMPAGEAKKETPLDLAVARIYHMNQIRKVRNKELAARDITFMRAVEAGDTDAQATIATEKQVLRDIPATFDITTGVTTPVQLKARWPAELPARE